MECWFEWLVLYHIDSQRLKNRQNSLLQSLQCKFPLSLRLYFFSFVIHYEENAKSDLNQERRPRYFSVLLESFSWWFSHIKCVNMLGSRHLLILPFSNCHQFFFTYFSALINELMSQSLPACSLDHMILFFSPLYVGLLQQKLQKKKAQRNPLLNWGELFWVWNIFCKVRLGNSKCLWSATAL